MASPFGTLVNMSPPTCSTPVKKMKYLKHTKKKIRSKSSFLKLQFHTRNRG